MTETQHIKQYQKRIGVQFLDPSLLRRALTHRSFVNEVDEDMRDNERLEFLGDAVLDLIVADMLFRRFPDVSEGELTQLRAALVRTDSLAMLASEIELGDYLLIGKGEEISGGRTRLTNLCRGYEALIGAMYLDKGIDAVYNFTLSGLTNLLEYILENDLHKDARSMLQERSQAELHFTPTYRVKDANGPDHEKEFLSEVLIGNVVLAQGSGTSKRAAAQSAARAGLKIIDEYGWSQDIVEAVERIRAEQTEQSIIESESEHIQIQIEHDLELDFDDTDIPIEFTEASDHY